jgi:guanylate kinase
MSVAAFRERIARDEFLEWEEVYRNHYYGTLKSEIERIWNGNRHVVFDVDVVGGLNLKQHFGQLALAIFVKPPTLQELERRLRLRSTDKDDMIRDRMVKAAAEMDYADRFDVVLVNDQLEETLARAQELVRDFLDNPLNPAEK